eukprot:scaffold68145_cov33-Tisochrysis_lutea.AAC.3
MQMGHSNVSPSAIGESISAGRSPDAAASCCADGKRGKRAEGGREREREKGGKIEAGREGGRERRADAAPPDPALSGKWREEERPIPPPSLSPFPFPFHPVKFTDPAHRNKLTGSGLLATSP